MAGLPRQVAETRLDRRMVPRSEMSLGVTLHRVGEEAVIPAAIANLSATGFLAELPVGSAVPELLDVDLPHAGRRQAQVVWRSGPMAGCNFTVPLARADLSAARLKSTFVEPSEAEAPAAPAAPAAKAPPIYSIGPSDPIWDMLNEASPHEKWPLTGRVAVILAATLALWTPVVAVAAFLR